MNKRIITTIFFIFGLLAMQGHAQGAQPASSEKGFNLKENWHTDYDKAKSLAAEGNRLVLVNFTGSDWCPPCIQLNRNVFSTTEFAAYAEKNLVLLELDFPRRTAQSDEQKRRNRELAGSYEVTGFPTLVLLDSDGKEVTRSVGYMPGGPAKLKQWIEGAPQK